MTTRCFAVCLLASFGLSFTVLAHPHHSHLPAEEMAGAANSFLASLSAEQQAKAQFEFKDAERQNWNFVPMPRKGLPLKEMTLGQRNLAQALLSSGLSQRGLIKTHTIISLEEILFELENRHPRRDAELYYVTVFGKPGPAGTWGWRFEGHHVAINMTIVNGRDISATPSFFGSNPAEVKQGPRQGLRALAGEEDLGRELLRSLTAEQRETAIFQKTAPRDIITGNSRKAKPFPATGISAAQLNEEQKVRLMHLIEEYVRRCRQEVADKDIEKIRAAGIEKIHFGWAGSEEPGQGHYYRVQGPTFLLEYDNTQNNANHVHAAWRDFENDFGEDLLRRHYELHSHE